MQALKTEVSIFSHVKYVTKQNKTKKHATLSLAEYVNH